jgi:hypothetical protein
MPAPDYSRWFADWIANDQRYGIGGDRAQSAFDNTCRSWIINYTQYTRDHEFADAQNAVRDDQRRSNH